jgi:hypothetical protein
MLDFVTIEKITAKAARAKVPANDVERVLVEPTVDSGGQDALRITLVLRPEAVKTWTGDDALDVLVAIQHALLAQQEERLAIVHYATEAELNEADLPDEL